MHGVLNDAPDVTGTAPNSAGSFNGLRFPKAICLIIQRTILSIDLLATVGIVRPIHRIPIRQMRAWSNPLVASMVTRNRSIAFPSSAIVLQR